MTLQAALARYRIWPLELTGRAAVALAGLIAFLLFLSTLQLDINGSSHPYVTDVGEIQNALPRWGTIHFTGYPQFTFLGSVFVSLMGFFGLAPAAAASLFSAIWGAVTISLLTYLALLFSVPPAAAVVTALLYALSTSFWVDASIAEVHTMTMALRFGAVIVALSFSRSGQRRYLYLLAFLCGMGLAHQRAFAFAGLGLLILVLPQWPVILRSLPGTIGLFLIGPLTYLYLPLRAWMGADWLFNAPGTWNGFWSIIFDNKAERVVTIPQTAAEWGARLQDVARLLADDWPWPLLVIGLLGLIFAGTRVSRLERLALNLSWIPYLAISSIIWIGRVGEALLAIKLPIAAFSALGLAFISQSLWQRSPWWGRISVAGWMLAAAFLYLSGRPDVLAVTRDPGAEAIIGLVAQTTPAADGRPTTFMALEGNDYWQLAYAQAYKDHFPHLNIVNHQRDFAAILDGGDHLLTLSQTFYLWPLETWEQQLGQVYLSANAPGIIEIRRRPILAPVDSATSLLDLENGITINRADLSWVSPDTLLLSVDWQATGRDGQEPLADYSVAIHLVAADPPAGPNDIISQSDRSHPVDGWYPTSRWTSGELVSGQYLVDVPAGSQPVAVRLGMYQVLADGQFENTPWYSLPVPSLQ